MDKAYKIGSLDKRKKQAIVYSTNFFRLEEYQDEVASTLKEKSFKGTVIFDLLLSNGNTFNRFIEVFFNGEAFEASKISNSIDSSIIDKSTNFYSSHTELLENSILSKTQRFLIKRKSSLC